jgi:hypothetical protein
VTDELDVCCWHDAFASFPSFLQPLAFYAGSQEVAAIGGATVVIPTGVETAAPGTVTVGGTCQVVATVIEDGSPKPNVEVTFEVLEGPHAGRTAKVLTGADGTATFDLLADQAGVDVVEARYLDSLERRRADTSACTAVLAAAAAPGTPAVVVAAPAPRAASPVKASPAFTG